MFLESCSDYLGFETAILNEVELNVNPQDSNFHNHWGQKTLQAKFLGLFLICLCFFVEVSNWERPQA